MILPIKWLRKIKEDHAKKLLKYKWTLPVDVLPGSSSSRFPVSNTPDSNEDYSPPPPKEADYSDFTDSKVLEKPPSEEGSRSHASIALFATSRALAGPNSFTGQTTFAGRTLISSCSLILLQWLQRGLVPPLLPPLQR
jgi:hypothetical protein